MTISQIIKFPLWNKDTRWDTKMLLCWCNSLRGSTLFSFWSGEGGKNSMAFLWTVDLSVIFVIQVQILVLEGTAWLAVIMGDMMICAALSLAMAKCYLLVSLICVIH
jgi:hypothetical protein